MAARTISSQLARFMCLAGILLLIPFWIPWHPLAPDPSAETLVVDKTTGTVNPADPCPNPRSSALYKTIQKAIDCSAAGDTVRVSAGAYSENVQVGKALVLLGANAGVDARGGRAAETVVNGGGTSAPIALGASGAVLDGFKIIAGQNGLGAGVWIGGATNVQVLNNVITDNAIGVAIISGCPCTVRHNLFTANNRSGAAGGKALYVETTNGLVFDGNSITGHTVDIPIVFASTPPASIHHNVTFTGNTIYGNTYNGAYLLSVNGGTISSNTFVGDGLFFQGGNHDINVTTNNFSSGSPAINIGLRADGNPYGQNSNLNIQFNRFVDNTTAINLGRNYSGTLNAEKNWWGCNYGPGATGAGCTASANGNTGAPIDANPWLTLRIFTSQPAVAQNGGKVTVSADLRGASDGGDTTGQGQVPDAIQAHFNSTLGLVTPAQSGTAGGRALSTFTAGPALGTATIGAAIDHQTASLTIPITPNYLYLPLISRD